MKIKTTKASWSNSSFLAWSELGVFFSFPCFLASHLVKWVHHTAGKTWASRVCLASELCGWARVWAVCQLLPESLGQGSPQYNLVYLILLSVSRTLILMTAKVYVVTVGSQPCNSFAKMIWLGQLWPYFNTSVPFETLRWKVMHYFPRGCWSWLTITVCWIPGSNSAGLSVLGWQIWRGAQWMSSLKQPFWTRCLKLTVKQQIFMSPCYGQAVYWDTRLYETLSTRAL